MSISPLGGVKVLITRPVEQASAWSEALAAVGADVVLYPTIEVLPPPTWDALDEAFKHLGEYEWLVFASATTVRFTFARRPAAIGTLSTAPPKIAAVGSETARVLQDFGLRVSLVPGQQRQEGLVAAFADLRPGTRVLFPQAVSGRDDLSKFLTGHGCIVDVVPASQTLPIRHLPPLPVFDVATFASPSALRAFVAGHGADRLKKPAAVVVIGPTTAAAAKALGIAPVVAAAPNVQAVIRAIEKSIAVRGGQ